MSSAQSVNGCGQFYFTKSNVMSVQCCGKAVPIFPFHNPTYVTASLKEHESPIVLLMALSKTTSDFFLFQTKHLITKLRPRNVKKI
jgi:hypothetical protein